MDVRNWIEKKKAYLQSSLLVFFFLPDVPVSFFVLSFFSLAI